MLVGVLHSWKSLDMSVDAANPHPSLPRDAAASWLDHIEGINALGEAILTSGWKPTAILGIARGGLIAATILAYKLDVRNIHALQVQHYDDENSRLESGPQFVNEPQPFATLDIRTERLLIVDDIIDTGETLKFVRNAAVEHAEEIRVAALYVRPDQEHAADWYWKVEKEAWVVFPWALED